MKRGFRPPIVGQIFATVPCAKSRCLSAFVSIARNQLPLTKRYEPSQMLFAAGVVLLVLGELIGPVFKFGHSVALFGVVAMAVAFGSSYTQDRVVVGQTRWRLIRQLDEARRSVGLDEVILPESLELLEAAAQQWERIEHELSAKAWDEQISIKQRISQLSHSMLEDVLVRECGTAMEAKMDDASASESIQGSIAALTQLANLVDAAGSALNSYPREGYETTGVEPLKTEAAIQQLEAFLSDVPHHASLPDSLPAEESA